MPKTLQIGVELKTEWRRVEPDGSPCDSCADPVLMNPVALFAAVRVGAGGFSPFSPAGTVLCQSCAAAHEVEVSG